MNTTENIASNDHSVSAAGEYERQHDDPVGQALVLADALDAATEFPAYPPAPYRAAAAELRRLHAENEALRERVQEVGAVGRSEHVRRVELEAQMEAIGAGGVSGPLLGKTLAGIPPVATLDSIALMRAVMQADDALAGHFMRGTTNWAAAIGKAVQDAVLAAQPPAIHTATVDACITRLELGFGTSSAPVSVLRHHFGRPARHR